jgi:hypothetical protein
MFEVEKPGRCFASVTGCLISPEDFAVLMLFDLPSSFGLPIGASVLQITSLLDSRWTLGI